MVVRFARVVLLAGALAACSRTETPAGGSTAASAAQQPAPVAAAGTCPRTGHWGDCQLRARLDQSGLAPHSTEEKVGDLPPLEPKPLMLMIGKSGLAAYFYADSAARKRAAATLDTTRYIPQAKPVSLKRETTLIQNDNALVLLFSVNEHQRERVADAITAGPPQP